MLKEIDIIKKLIITLSKESNQKLIPWPREIAIGKKVLKKYNKLDLNFWEDFTLDYKLNSLAFLLTEDGKNAIIDNKKRRDFEKTIDNTSSTEYKLESNKIGEDKEIVKKQTLLEFLG